MTTIRFALPQSLRISLKIYNILGEEIAALLDEDLSAGFHTTVWNAENISSGIYFYRLQAGAFTETRKLVVLK